MDGRLSLAAVLLVALLVVPAPAMPLPAATYPATPRLVVAVNAPFAVAGDNASFDVYTYAGGNAADAAALPSVQVVAQTPVPPSIPVTGFGRVATGHYRGYLVLPRVPSALTPLTPDPGLQTEGEAIIVANATVAGVSLVSGRFLIWVTPGIYLKLYANVSTVNPVQPLQLTAELFNGSQRVDADPGSIHVGTVSVGGLGPPVTPDRTGVGVYQADMILDFANDTGFYVNASVGGIHAYQQLLETAPGFSLPYPGFELTGYQAWFQTLSSNASGLRGNLWVADADGRPSAGVAVVLDVPTMGISLNGTTDSAGRFPVDLAAAGAGQLFPSFVIVGAGGPHPLRVYAFLPFSPCVGGVQYLPTGYATPEDPLLMPGGGLRDLLAAGTTVTRRYGFHDQGFGGALGPIANTSMNYYLLGQGSGTVYAAGHAITDATGNLSLQFEVPTEDVFLEFDLPPPLSTLTVLGYAVASPAMGLQVSPLTLGGPTRISVTFGAQGSLYAGAGFAGGFGEIGLVSTTDGTWERLTQSTGCSSDYLREAPDALNTTISLPSFLPSSGTYVVTAWTMPGNRITEQFAVLTPGESADIPVGGGGTPGLTAVLEWAAIGTVLAAVAVVGVLMFLRRKPKAPPEPPPTPPGP